MEALTNDPQMPKFKPSDVNTNGFPPLVGTLGKSEIEYAAALVVRACVVLGDAWQPLLPEVIGKVGVADFEAKIEPWHSLATNPFIRPDFHGLVTRGFARWRPDFGEAARSAGDPAIELLPAGLVRLTRWVSPAARA